jgi:putative redox protein
VLTTASHATLAEWPVAVVLPVGFARAQSGYNRGTMGMMTANAQWSGGLSFTGSAGSGFQVAMGASVPDGGKNDGFRPMELLIVGLAGCTGMDVVSILVNKKQPVTGFEVRVEADRAETYPMIFTRLRIHYVVKGNVDRSVLDYAIEMSSKKYCSAEAMLAEVATIEHSAEIVAE